MEPSVAERVEAGFAKLDEIVPGWIETIDKPVNIASVNECPCGQVFGNWASGLVQMGIDVGVAYYYGFVDEDPEDNDALNAEWERRIEDRLEEQERIVDELIEAGEAHRLAFDNTGALVVVS